ncbi:MAG: protein-tyrosine-phosphatase [Streptosporangiales bacterium]|nr:protein-tyrosine-phosphatase [Streptosporangiales bacterium]
MPATPSPFETAQVTARGGGYSVTWRAPGVDRVHVRAATTAVNAAAGPEVALAGPSATIDVPPPGPARRWYFALTPDDGPPLTLAERSLGLTGAPNFRDAGGYRAADGSWVRMGLFYRADGLNTLTEEDLRAMSGLGLATVCDLRTAAERAAAPDRLPEAVRSVVLDVQGDAPLGGDLLALFEDPARAAAMFQHGGAVRLMAEINRSNVAAPSARRNYARLLELLADPYGGPLVYHCTGGKDRTGWASALVLSLLGVPRETVIADYLASNGYLREKLGDLLHDFLTEHELDTAELNPELVAPVMQVHPEYLQAAFDEVEARYGDLTGYVRDGLALDPSIVDALRARLLTR